MTTSTQTIDPVTGEPVYSNPDPITHKPYYNPVETPAKQTMPSPTHISYDPITAASYKNVNIQKFGKNYANFNRNQILQNYDLADTLAKKQIQTELETNQQYVPAQAALKRSETSADNTFNQGQRTAQINSALPGVTKQLDAQAARAESYASGRMPSDIEDRGLELGIRSNAADNASAAGFGASSSVAKKSSDLMSATQRMQMSQYGDQLLTSNIGTKSNLELAPTEYSNAGSQITTMPSISGSQLASSNLSNINNDTLISSTNALSSRISQNQYQTNLQQGTNEFNAQNQLSADSFNATADNNFALTGFQYDVGYAGTVAGVNTANNQYQIGLAEQDTYQQIMEQYKNKAQDSNDVSAIANTVGTIAAVMTTLSGSSTDTSAGSTALDITGSTSDPTTSTASATGTQSSSSGSSTGTTNSDTSATNTKSASDLTSSALTTTSPTTAITSPTTSTTASTPTTTTAATQSSGVSVPTTASTSSGTSSTSSPLSTFSTDTGVSLPLDNSAVTQQILKASSTSLNMSGIYDTYNPSTQYVGNSSSGTPMYASTALLQSSDTNSGSSLAGVYSHILDMTGGLTDEDKASITEVGNTSKDSDLLASLDTAQQAGDTKGFSNTLLSAVGKPELKSSKTVGDASSAYTAYSLYQNWDRMSPAQKSMAVASVGLQNKTDSKGTPLTEKPIPATEGTQYKSLKVKDGVDLIKKGYNVKPLVNNWEQVNDIHSLIMDDNG